jgi:M3 family oligoendopeptidase
MKYKYYPDRSSSLTAAFVEAEYTDLIGRIEEAESSDAPDLWRLLYDDWNALKCYVGSERSRVNYGYSKNLNDPELEEADRYLRQEVVPAASMGDFALTGALLKSRHREAIGGEFNPRLMEVYKVGADTIAPVNNDLRVKAGDLGQRYTKIIASALVTIDGETMTLTRAGDLLTSRDAAVRERAFRTLRQWFVDRREELGEIFDELVRIRTAMGRNLGHENYITLGYQNMERTDYGPEDVALFRRSVQRYVVPLQAAIHRKQMREAGTGSLRPWDSSYDPAITLPANIVPVDTQLEKAQRVFDALSPVLGGYFRRMREGGWIDLENRPGKRSGAFCTSFPDEGHPAILCNSTGDSDDVRTLVHEMGHAFQAWESSAAIDDMALLWPSSDACEIHSKGMEMLSLRYMEEFFSDEDAEKFRLGRWKYTIQGLCYICIVDEFQHWVYENPDATPAEREAAWGRIWDIYRPGIDYTGIEEYKETVWYGQAHIFRSPFYYIDYAIADTAAMQLALIDAEDHERAMDIYMNLCRIGGTMGVLDIFAAAGLRSPFDPDLMRDLMAHAAAELGLDAVTVADPV